MGQSNFVNQKPKQSFVRGLRSARTGIDFVLLVTTAALTLFGLLMVYSAGPKFALSIDMPADYFVLRQLIWAGVGALVVIGLTLLDYHIYKRLTVIMMAGTLLMLAVVVAFGDSTLGAVRSIVGGSIRPSELAKIVTIIYVSVWLCAKHDVLNDMTLGLIPLVFMLGLMGGLIFIQPDLSAALTVIVLGGLLFFLAGGEWRQIALVLVAAVVLGWLIVNVYPTGKVRVTEYISGLQDPLKASYHVQRSLEAIINGGVFGVGIGHSSTKFTGLPVAHTDSIFAIIAEETGLIGVAVLIIAYLVILWRGLSIAKRAPDQLGRLLAAGITLWITIEAVLNMGVMINLIPQAGNALPFISYGGSSLLMTMSGIGILLNIGRLSELKNIKGESTFGAVINLRGGDRRRSVSSPVRPASTWEER
jgi:cell division protein FtsW